MSHIKSEKCSRPQACIKFSDNHVKVMLLVKCDKDILVLEELVGGKDTRRAFKPDKFSERTPSDVSWGRTFMVQASSVKDRSKEIFEKATKPRQNKPKPSRKKKKREHKARQNGQPVEASA